jgi:PAS domain S-box-containing protein
MRYAPWSTFRQRKPPFSPLLVVRAPVKLRLFQVPSNEAPARDLDLLATAVLLLDAAGRVTHANPAAENLFGYGAPELVGRNCITMLMGGEERERTAKWWADFIAAAQPGTLTAERCLRRDGLELACEWTLTPLVDEANRVTTIIMQGRDITQQRAAERVRSEFTSTLSHELRTPLTSILGSLQLLRSGALGEVAKDQEELLEVAERNGQRLLDLINEVLDIEKIESGRVSLVPEPVDLESVLGESIRLNQGYADRFHVRLGHPGSLPQPHLRPLRPGRLRRFAHPRRHRPGPRHQQAPHRHDGRAARLRGSPWRRHDVLFRPAGPAGGSRDRGAGDARPRHRARQRLGRLPRDGA